MKLKLVRSQKTSMFKGAPIFQIQAVALVSPEERSLIAKHKLGADIVYASEQWKNNVAAMQASAEGATSIIAGLRAKVAAALNLKITVNGLIDGTTVECKSLDEMLGAEDAIITACKNLRSFLEVAVTFDGREVLLDI